MLQTDIPQRLLYDPEDDNPLPTREEKLDAVLQSGGMDRPGGPMDRLLKGLIAVGDLTAVEAYRELNFYPPSLEPACRKKVKAHPSMRAVMPVFEFAAQELEAAGYELELSYRKGKLYRVTLIDSDALSQVPVYAYNPGMGDYRLLNTIGLKFTDHGALAH